MRTANFWAVIAGLAAIGTAQASPVTFASFDPVGTNVFKLDNPSNTGVAFNTGAGNGANTTFTNGAISVKFSFKAGGIVGALPPELLVDIYGLMTLSISSTDNQAAGIAQPFSDTNGQLLIAIDCVNHPSQALCQAGLYNGGVNPGTSQPWVLLSAANFSGNLTKLSSSTGAFNSSTSNGDPIVFASDFLAFAGGSDEDLTLSFTGVHPCITNKTSTSSGTTPVCGAGTSFNRNYFQTFVTSGNGTFAAEPTARYLGEVPEPGSVTLSAIGGLLLAAGIFRKRKA